MTIVEDPANNRPLIIDATAEHTREISRIYRSVVIDPQVFLDLASASSKRSDAARQLIKSHGGFLSPPNDADMKLALLHGFCKVYLHDGKVVGFNRIVTDPCEVQQAFFTEFQLNLSAKQPTGNNFPDWSGHCKHTDYKTLTRVRWIDRDEARIAMQAAQAGLQNNATGRLAWAIDAAVNPLYRHLGVSKAMSMKVRSALKPRTGFIAYRMFEICKVNDTELMLENKPSKGAFVDPASVLFAYTQEDIRVRNDIDITVRWNHWLKHY